jgi:hypothetical protein
MADTTNVPTSPTSLLWQFASTLPFASSTKPFNALTGVETNPRGFDMTDLPALGGMKPQRCMPHRIVQQDSVVVVLNQAVVLTPQAQLT